jgi:exodeoxyribonuclease VII large subunit
MLSKNLMLLSPQNTLEQRTRLFLAGVDRFHKSMRYHLEKSMTRFERAQSNLGKLSPLNILDRGYSAVKKFPDKMLVKRITQLAKNDLIEILLKDGSAKCQVLEIFPDGQT